ncbi:hypothetical protein AOLI_G00033690, partial [Acnodon oligacanthus]
RFLVHTPRDLQLWDCFELSSEEGSQCEKVPVFLERTGIGLIARGSSFRQPKQCSGVTPLHWSSAFHMEKCSQNSAPRLKVPAPYFLRQGTNEEINANHDIPHQSAVSISMAFEKDQIQAGYKMSFHSTGTSEAN